MTPVLGRYLCINGVFCMYILVGILQYTILNYVRLI